MDALKVASTKCMNKSETASKLFADNSEQLMNNSIQSEPGINEQLANCLSAILLIVSVNTAVWTRHNAIA